MEALKEKVENLTNHVEEFVETYYDLTVANITKKSADAASAGVGFVLTWVFCFFIILFIGIGTGWWLGDILKNRPAGFFITAGIFLVILVILLAVRRSVIFPYIKNMIVKNMYD